MFYFYGYSVVLLGDTVLLHKTGWFFLNLILNLCGRASIVCNAGIILPLVPRYLLLWGGGGNEVFNHSCWKGHKLFSHQVNSWDPQTLRALHLFWVGASCTALSMGYFHCLLPNSNRLPLALLSPACRLLNSRSHWSSWTPSYCGLKASACR